jgi:hypothetical protein
MRDVRWGKGMVGVKNQQHEPTSEPTKENEVSVLKLGGSV